MKLYKIYDSDMNGGDIEANKISLLAHKCWHLRLLAEKARADYLKCEEELLNLPTVKNSLKSSGTNNFLDGFLKITTKLNQKWDQEQLADILMTRDWPIMPFDIEYKPSASKLKLLAQSYPAYSRLLSVACTESPAKPYFSFKE